MLYQVIHQHTPEQCPAKHKARTEAMNNAINEHLMNQVQSKFSAGCITAPVTVSFL